MESSVGELASGPTEESAGDIPPSMSEVSSLRRDAAPGGYPQSSREINTRRCSELVHPSLSGPEDLFSVQREITADCRSRGFRLLCAAPDQFELRLLQNQDLLLQSLCLLFLLKLLLHHVELFLLLNELLLGLGNHLHAVAELLLRFGKLLLIHSELVQSLDQDLLVPLDVGLLILLCNHLWSRFNRGLASHGLLYGLGRKRCGSSGRNRGRYRGRNRSRYRGRNRSRYRGRNRSRYSRRNCGWSSGWSSGGISRRGNRGLRGRAAMGLHGNGQTHKGCYQADRQVLHKWVSFRVNWSQGSVAKTPAMVVS